MKRIFRKIHLWLSIPFGLIFAVMCFSAAMLMLEPSRDLKITPLETEPLHIGQIMHTAKASLPDSVEVTGLTIAAAPEMAYRLSLSTSPHDGYYVNQYTGEVLGRSERKPFFATMFKLHRWLGGSRDSVGKTLTGLTTLAAVLVLLTGIFLWVTRARKSIGRALAVRFKSMRAFWVSLHISGGIYAALILLLCCLTGLTWSYRWYSNGVNALFGVEAQAGGHGKPDKDGKPDKGGKPEKGEKGGRHGRSGEGRGEGITDYLGYDRAFEQVKADAPNFKTITLSDGEVSVAFDGMGNQRASDTYSFDTATGQITSYTAYADAPTAKKLRGWIYSLHTGAWGGPIIKWLTFILVILGVTLPLSGYYIWLVRRLKN